MIANASWGTPRVHYQPYGPIGSSAEGAPGTFTNSSGTYKYWQKSIWGYGGPSEHDLETLSDNKTLIAVMRMDGDDTCSTGAYEYYHAAYSTDFGQSFTRPAPLKGAGCARPRIKRFSSGPLLMTGGRMCVENMTGLFAWLNLDGMGGFGSSSPGDAWTWHSISYQHNLRWKGDKRYLFTDAVNSTWADDRPRFFDETQAYTSILLTGPRSATIMYQQWAEPKGHNGTTFAIQVEIRPDDDEQPPAAQLKTDDSYGRSGRPGVGTPRSPSASCPASIAAEVNATGLLSVMHLNATADGVSDDSEAVQQTVRLAVGACGGRVFFPSGTYLINKTVVLCDGEYGLVRLALGHRSWPTPIFCSPEVSCQSNATR
eukprot:SAG11_NODE_1281_length_5311_cov_4.192441_4_plen_371_part_00